MTAKYILYQPYKWLIFAPLMLVITLLTALLSASTSMIFSSRVGNFIGSCWARVTCWITPVSVFIKGRENIEPGKSYVIVSNHQSIWDIFLLYGNMPIDFRWVMKKELRTIPFVGYACEKVGHIFIDRSSPREAARSLEVARKKLVNGVSVVIFPEGTRSRRKEMNRFKNGAFKLARDLELDILPVTIVDSYKICSGDFLDLMPGRAGIVIHPVIKTADYIDSQQELSDHARQIIESAL